LSTPKLDLSSLFKAKNTVLAVNVQLLKSIERWKVGLEAAHNSSVGGSKNCLLRGVDLSVRN
jgi:hypothetical protein